MFYEFVCLPAHHRHLLLGELGELLPSWRGEYFTTTCGITASSVIFITITSINHLYFDVHKHNYFCTQYQHCHHIYRDLYLIKNPDYHLSLSFVIETHVNVTSITRTNQHILNYHNHDISYLDSVNHCVNAIACLLNNVWQARQMIGNLMPLHTCMQAMIKDKERIKQAWCDVDLFYTSINFDLDKIKFKTLTDDVPV